MVLLVFDVIAVFMLAIFKQKAVLTKSFSYKSKINAKKTVPTARFYVGKLNNANNNIRFGEISKIKQHFFAFTKMASYLINYENTSKVAYAPAPVTMLPHHSFW